MNKEEFDINQELEQMRQDYAALKERFDKQQIINEQLMQHAIPSGSIFFERKSLRTSFFIACCISCSFMICCLSNRSFNAA